ncbi:MAG: sulfite exporter TauE/SafE family protein [Candidatus Thorarchaeota archaeon]
MDPLIVLLIGLAIPIGILVGLGASIIGLTAWPLIVPLFFAVGGFSLHEALLSSMVVDLILAIVLTLFYTKRTDAGVEVPYGLKMGSVAGIVAGLAVLVAFPLIAQFSDVFKGGASIVNFALGSVFIIQAIRTPNRQPQLDNVQAETEPPSKLQQWRQGLTDKQKVMITYVFCGLQGLLTGVIAIGGAMNIVLLLIILMGYSTLRAVGTAMVATTVMLAVTVITYLVLLGFMITTWYLVILYGVIAGVSCILGAFQSQRVSERGLRFVIGIVVLAAAVFATLQILLWS